MPDPSFAASFSIFLSSDGKGAEDASGYVPDGTDGGSFGVAAAPGSGATTVSAARASAVAGDGAACCSRGEATGASSASASAGLRARAAAAMAAASPPFIARIVPTLSLLSAATGAARGNLAASARRATSAYFSAPTAREPGGDADAAALPPDLVPDTLLVVMFAGWAAIAPDAIAPWHPIAASPDLTS